MHKIKKPVLFKKTKPIGSSFQVGNLAEFFANALYISPALCYNTVCTSPFSEAGIRPKRETPCLSL